MILNIQVEIPDEMVPRCHRWLTQHNIQRRRTGHPPIATMKEFLEGVVQRKLEEAYTTADRARARLLMRKFLASSDAQQTAAEKALE